MVLVGISSLEVVETRKEWQRHMNLKVSGVHGLL